MIAGNPVDSIDLTECGNQVVMDVTHEVIDVVSSPEVDTLRWRKMSRVYLSDDEDGVANDDKEPEQKDAEEEEEEEVLRWFGELSEDEVEAEMTGFTTWEDQSATTTKSETSDGRLDFATGSDIGLTGIVLAEEIEPFATEVRRNPLVMASADPIGMPSLNRVRTASATKSTGMNPGQSHVRGPLVKVTCGDPWTSVMVKV
eukprot:gene26122-32001_t